MIIKCISIYLFIGVTLLSITFVNSFLRGKSSYAKALGLLSLSIQVYLLGYLMEINSILLKEMLFWNQIQYFGIPFIAALWLVVSMLYTGRGKYLQGYKSLIVFAVPLMTFIIRLTNDWHHLYYSRIQLHKLFGMNIMLLTKGPWYLFFTCYAIIAFVLCTGFYFQRYKKSIGDERIQFRLLFLASALPYIALILDIINIGGIGIDYLALIMPPCILFINMAMTQFNFLEFKTLARERVFEDSTSGLVLLNRFYRVVNFNESSVHFFRWFNAQIKEEQLESLLQEQQELLESIKLSENRVFHLVVEGEEKYVNVNVSGVKNKEETVGLLISFEDVTEREILRRRLVEMANTDELSGLNNRRRFRECAQEAFQHARLCNEHLSVLMMDIDYFKKINDSFGHMAGDAVIRNFSEMLLTAFRTDVVGRMGGEEFAVVMSNTDSQQAYIKTEYFRQAVEKNIIIFEQHKLRVTVSIGVAEFNEGTPDFDALLNTADSAMYEAKRAGRNSTVIDKQSIYWNNV